jgi:MFS family permease
LSIHRNLYRLAAFNFLLDFRLYAPIAILYFAQVSGSFALGMSIFSITMLASALLEVPTGVFSDRIGRKRTVVCGALAGTAAVTFYAIGGSYAMLVVGAVFEGLARSFFSGNNDALLYDSLTEVDAADRFQEFMGKTTSMLQFASAISAVLGSLIAAASFSTVMWLSVIPQALTVLISLTFSEPKLHSHAETNIYAHLREAYQNIVQNPRLRALSAASIITFAFGEAAFTFRAAFIQTLWPVWAIGIARTLSNIAAAFSFYLSGRLIKRFGEFPLLAGSVLYSETLVLLAMVFPGVLSPVAMGTTSIFFGVKNVSLGGLMQREFTPHQRATMGSLTSFAGSLVFVPASLLLGWLADTIGVTPALIAVTVVLFTPLWFYYVAFRSKPLASSR